MVTGEVAGSIAEKALLDALFTGQAHLHDTIERHMAEPLPMIGGGQPVSEAVALLEKADAAHGADRRQARRRAHPPGPARPPVLTGHVSRKPVPPGVGEAAVSLKHPPGPQRKPRNAVVTDSCVNRTESATGMQHATVD